MGWERARLMEAGGKNWQTSRTFYRQRFVIGSNIVYYRLILVMVLSILVQLSNMDWKQLLCRKNQGEPLVPHLLTPIARRTLNLSTLRMRQGRSRQAWAVALAREFCELCEWVCLLICCCIRLISTSEKAYVTLIWATSCCQMTWFRRNSLLTGGQCYHVTTKHRLQSIHKVYHRKKQFTQ